MTYRMGSLRLHASTADTNRWNRPTYYLHPIMRNCIRCVGLRIATNIAHVVGLLFTHDNCYECTLECYIALRKMMFLIAIMLHPYRSLNLFLYPLQSLTVSFNNIYLEYICCKVQCAFLN
jgi:hypothetical protein